MKVNLLQFENFRNLKNSSIKPCENLNVIYGENAQGKTNILEAIWLFCGGHSFRNNKENELINYDKNFYKLEMNFDAFQREQKVKIIFSDGKKRIFINDIEKKSSSYLTEIFSAVVFSPDHLDLIKDNPKIRRKFLDTAICQQKIKYAYYLSKYQKILSQRNTLLKDIYSNKNLEDTLDIWDDILCDFGAKIILDRINYVNKLKEVAKKYHDGISNKKEILNISYQSCINFSKHETEESIKERLLDLLRKNKNDDIRYGYTNIGPHREDLLIEINNKSTKTYASQGQQRSAVLSLKLSEAQLLYDTKGEKPIILLDDVLSELDNARQDYLLNKIKDYQVFITCCEENNKLSIKNGKIFRINNGEIN